MKTKLLAAVITAALSFTSCDSPKTIAWSYYYCAEDALNAGDPQKAKEYMKGVKMNVDSVLTFKADSLMKVIDQALSEKSDSI
ncbi:MAG: hypothetical protein IKH80_10830 [Bacteroidaceae bacterium]|jgi:uncharacterized protein|nr:hypothetical protein [Bacteroidaceae bacterium]